MECDVKDNTGLFGSDITNEETKEWIPFTKKREEDKTSFKAKGEHRRVDFVISTAKIMSLFKESVRRGEYTDEELLHLYRVISTQLMKMTDDVSRWDRDEIILKMQNHIKRQVSDAVERKSKLLRRRK